MEIECVAFYLSLLIIFLCLYLSSVVAQRAEEEIRDFI